ncbi:MAG: RidA family protein [Rhodothermales bacterium]|nr:RidA family protein [Rhodothermales bacterium]MBO6779268.1 RidA family protein [Rhodothermales bacterium]
MKRLLPLLLLVTACGTPPDEVPAGADVEYLNTPEYLEMGVPFSEAVRVDNMLYLAGQVGNLPGQFVLVEGGIQPETRQTMENIKAALERYGSSMDEVVKCTVFLEDMAEWGAMNEIYRTYFPENPPARSAVGSNGLAINARVEIECMAAMR